MLAMRLRTGSGRITPDGFENQTPKRVFAPDRPQTATGARPSCSTRPGTLTDVGLFADVRTVFLDEEAMTMKRSPGRGRTAGKPLANAPLLLARKILADGAPDQAPLGRISPDSAGARTDALPAMTEHEATMSIAAVGLSATTTSSLRTATTSSRVSDSSDTSTSGTASTGSTSDSGSSSSTQATASSGSTSSSASGTSSTGGASGGGGSGSSSSGKTEVSEISVTANGFTTTTITYSDGSTEVTVTVATNQSQTYSATGNGSSSSNGSSTISVVA